MTDMSEHGITILKDQSIVLIELTGTISLPVLMETAERVYANPDYRADFSTVIDLRLATFDLGYRDLRSYLHRINDDPKRLQGDAVFVTDKPLSFGMARMYENMESEQFSQKIHFAKSVDEALELLANRKDQ